MLGLSRANCKLMLAGEPVTVLGSTLGLEFDLYIAGGEDDVAIYNALQAKLGGRVESVTYTCCQEHADEAGIMHVSAPGVEGACTRQRSARELPDV